ncbi:MAG: hypothetical protein RR821_04920 [Clostridia bacterium]
MNQSRKKPLVATVLLLALMLCALFLPAVFKHNPSQEQLFSKLLAHFEERGYTCELSPLADSEPSAKVAIFNASAWYKLTLGQEQVLVYFDESNRADYLSSLIDTETYGTVAHFGLRFVLTYQGSDGGILSALQEL